MGEVLKFIIQELSKPPFNKTYNVITFDSLEANTLLKIVGEVLHHIDYLKRSVDFDEDPEEALMLILNLLSVFKYDLPMDNLGKFKTDLLAGEKSVIYPLLEWLLQRIPELMVRSYLAKFLIKLEVPQEFLTDGEITELYSHYLELLEKFKESHRQNEQLKTSIVSTTEIKNDIENMDEEKRQLIKRLDRIKKKVDNVSDLDAILVVAKALHQERERKERLNLQMQDLHIASNNEDQKLQRIIRNMDAMKHSRYESSPESLIQRMEQEQNVNTYIAKEKLPKELKALQDLLRDLQKVHQLDVMKKSDLDKLIEKIHSLNKSISNLVEKRMVTSDPMDDKLSLFRQQAAIITHKKESNAELVKDLRNNLQELEKEIKEKNKRITELGGVEILKGDEFKSYVNMLRGKSTQYKLNRQKQSDMQAEIGVLSRTEELLKQQYEETEKKLTELEAETGITGFRKVQEDLEKVSAEKRGVDDKKTDTLSSISGAVMSLNKEIQDKKASLAPVIKKLQPLRQTFQDLSQQYDQKKATYNSKAAGFEVASKTQEMDVATLEEQCILQESRKYFLEAKLKIFTVQLNQAVNEMKNYLSGDPAVKKQLLREQFMQCIQDQEKLGKVLKEEQKHVQSSFQAKQNQMKLWKSLNQLFKCKQVCAQKYKLGGGSNFQAFPLS